MNIHFSDDDLRPIVEAVVAEMLRQRDADDAMLNGKLAYTEAEAAALLSVERYTLRDMRLRGEITATRA